MVDLSCVLRLCCKKEILKSMKRLWRLLGVLFLMAFLMNMMIELVSRKSVVSLADYMAGRPLVFLVNTLLVLTLFLPVLFVRRKWFVIAVAVVVWAVAGVTNGVLLMFRTTPFTATDLRLIKYGAALLTTYLSWQQIGAGIFLTAAAAFFCIFIWKKAPVDPEPVNLTQSACVAAVGMAAIWGTLNLAMMSGLVALHFGNIGQAYMDYGFPYCFANSVFNTGIARPEEYDRQVVAELEEEELVPENCQTGGMWKGYYRPAGANGVKYETPDIIMVQLESFFDPELWKNNPVKEDPIPFFRYLADHYPSGYLNVPSVGAGTANTEFECITGMNLDFFGPGEYPYKTVLQKKACESLAFVMKELGYRTHGIHNNEGTFYDRHKVFAQLGFDTFTPVEYMYDISRNPMGWCRDEVLADEVIQALDSDGEPDFIYAISVQGHGKYPSFAYYCEQIHDMNLFVEKLVYRLAKREKPAVLVLYGDHLPGFEWSREEMENNSLYQTPYVIWNNVGMVKTKRNLEAYQLAAHVLNLLHIHEGTMLRFHQHHLNEESESEEDYLEAMQVLEYDILYGDEEVYDGKSPFEATRMQMGILPVVQRSVTRQGEKIVVRGENFNEYSKICVDEKPVETVFVEKGLLRADGVLFKEGQEITVWQIGRDKVPLGMAQKAGGS